MSASRAARPARVSPKKLGAACDLGAAIERSMEESRPVEVEVTEHTIQSARLRSTARRVMHTHAMNRPNPMRRRGLACPEQRSHQKLLERAHRSRSGGSPLGIEFEPPLERSRRAAGVVQLGPGGPDHELTPGFPSRLPCQS
jgi:hypothetical protein